MRSTCVRVMLLLAVALAAGTAEAQLWKHFVPTARPAAGRRGDQKLTQDNGPWMILAASFSGNGSDEQAQDLADELRERYRLPAYVHEMSFDYSDKDRAPGRGVDEYGAPIRRRYQRGDRVREIAVLVGNYPSLDDPAAQETLDKIKTMQPYALRTDSEHTSQSMAQVREWQHQLLERLGKKRDRGPMSQAFLTRNPLLPREYFVPKGIDDFVAKMNRGVQHSLLDCNGKYTVKVATFRGKAILQTSTTESDKSGSIWKWNNNKERENPLVEAAENAHLLTEELRAHGWDAYEFHDRTESIVTIGSFADAGRTPDGQLAPTAEMQRIVQTFGAAYDTPADPLSGIGNDSITQQRVHQKEQEFNLKLVGQQQSQIVPGLNPKHVKIFKGGGKRKTIERVIPLDIYPTAIEVPKRSISSAYAG
jgi:hypothetical protein